MDIKTVLGINVAVPTELQTEVTRLINEVKVIDDEIKAARSESYARKVGNIEVDYLTHITTLRCEGSSLISQLANLLNLVQWYDKYRGRRITQGGTNKHYIESYW